MDFSSSLLPASGAGQSAAGWKGGKGDTSSNPALKQGANEKRLEGIQ